MRPVERLAHALRESGGLPDERRRDRPRAGPDLHAGLQRVRTAVVGCALVAVGIGRGELEDRDPLPVHAQLELVRLANGRAGEQVEQLQLDLVLGVPREVVLHRHAAARAERQAVPVLVLRQVRGDPERLAAGRHRRGSHGQAADRPRRVHVALQQRGRDLEDAGDVVEPVALVVGRHERGGVDVEGQQVADGVLVLGPIEPVERFGTTRIGTRRRHGVDLGLQEGGEGVAGADLRPRASDGRHRAGPQLADHLLPDVGVARHVAQIGRPQRDGDRSAGGQPLVVAGDAIAVEQRLVRDDRRGLRGGFLPRAGRRRGGEPRRPGHHPDAEQEQYASRHRLVPSPRPVRPRSLNSPPNPLDPTLFAPDVNIW